jgi:lysophospholipase L1-like esterase
MGARLAPLAVSGMDTDGLLQALNTWTYQAAIAKAQYISLTIGANDLLLPAVQKLTALADAAAEGDVRTLLTGLGSVGDSLTNREAQELYAQRTEHFKENWERIIARIRELNPTADIYVTNFYNPYSMLEYSLGPFSLHLGSVAQTYLDRMNAWLTESPSAGEYRVADIRDAGTNVCFSTRSLAGLDLDPHPSAEGHALIFKRLRSLWREAEAERRYTDLPGEQWARDAISAVTALGLMQGVGDRRFDPEGQLTLAQVLALAARLHSLRHTGEAAFDESSGSHWYDVYYRYCVNDGLITARTFRDLTQPATRAQTALVLAHALEEEDLPVIRRQERIPDVNIADYAAQEIYLLYRAGVLNGVDERGSFAPDRTLRRSEAAAILARLAEPELRTP